jgi:hypothetical protein
MSSMPWMFQSHIADAKIRRFETALQAIAGLDWNAMTSDQALANLRGVITVARVLGRIIDLSPTRAGAGVSCRLRRKSAAGDRA